MFHTLQTKCIHHKTRANHLAHKSSIFYHAATDRPQVNLPLSLPHACKLTFPLLIHHIQLHDFPHHHPTTFHLFPISHHSISMLEGAETEGEEPWVGCTTKRSRHQMLHIACSPSNIHPEASRTYRRQPRTSPSQLAQSRKMPP